MESAREKNSKGGFSIIEMVVTIGIMSLIIAGMMIANSRYGDSLLVTNLAYDVALTAREAQAYGLSVKEWREGINLGDSFGAAYGLRFSKMDTNTAYASKKFALFNDVSENGINNWTCGYGIPVPATLSNCKVGKVSQTDQTIEFMKEYNLGGGNRINRITVTKSDNSTIYYDFTNNTGTLTFVDIVFKRPQIAPCFQTNDSNFKDLCPQDMRSPYLHLVKSVEISFSNASGKFKRSVVIDSIGRIYVK